MSTNEFLAGRRVLRAVPHFCEDCVQIGAGRCRARNDRADALVGKFYLMKSVRDEFSADGSEGPRPAPGFCCGGHGLCPKP